MEAYHSSLRLGQQSHPVHASVPGNVNYVRNVLEIDIVVASHKRYPFRAYLEDREAGSAGHPTSQFPD
jgi:hypothetical protein